MKHHAATWFTLKPQTFKSPNELNYTFKQGGYSLTLKVTCKSVTCYSSQLFKGYIYHKCDTTS